MTAQPNPMPRASNVERAELCPGSIWACKDVPWKDNEHAARGRAIAAAVDLLMRTGPSAWNMIRKDPNIAAADLEGVEELYNQYLAQAPDDPQAQVLTEEKLDLAFIGLKSGKLDLAYLSKKFEGAVLADGKAGRSHVTDPENNRQLQSYACGLCKLHPWLQSVECVIIQPWAPAEGDRLRSHTFSRAELSRKAYEIKEISLRAQDPKAPRIAGRDQCRFCDAKDTCPQYAAMAGEQQAQKEMDKETAIAGVTMGTPIVVEPEQPIAFPLVVISAEVVAQAEMLQQRAEALKVVDQGTAIAAGKTSKELRGLWNQIEASREKVKGPVLALGRQIDQQARKAQGPLAAGADHLDKQVNDWNAKEEAKRRAAAEAEAKRLRELRAQEEKAREEARSAEEEALAKSQAATQALMELDTLPDDRRAAAEEEANRNVQAAQEALERRDNAQQTANQAAGTAAYVAQLSQTAAAPVAIPGYRQADKFVAEIPDLSKVPAQWVAAVLMVNQKVLDNLVKTKALDETSGAGWLKITRTKEMVRR